MFFVLSKLIWLVAAPTNLLLLVLAAGIASWRFRRRRASGASGFVIAAAAAALLACGILPVGTLLLRPLEDRFAPLPRATPEPAGIVVLGGAIDQVIDATRGGTAIEDAAERITEAVVLSRRFPGADLIYTGGSASLVSDIGSEAADARRLWIELGVDPARIRIEPLSRNTFENARFSRALLQPRPDQRWILVTSAWHMPRAVGLFRAAGFSVVPDPVDYRTTGTRRDFEPNRDAGAGLARFDMAAKEWVGLLAYRLSGKIADLFPGP